MSATNPATRKILWIQILYSSFGFGLAEWVYILKFLTRCPTPARAIYTFAVAASTTPVLNLSPVSTTADLLYVTKAECVRVYQNIADRINRRETTKQCWPRRENPSPQSSKKYQRKREDSVSLDNKYISKHTTFDSDENTVRSEILSSGEYWLNKRLTGASWRVAL